MENIMTEEEYEKYKRQLNKLAVVILRIAKEHDMKEGQEKVSDVLDKIIDTVAVNASHLTSEEIKKQISQNDV